MPSHLTFTDFLRISGSYLTEPYRRIGFVLYFIFNLFLTKTQMLDVDIFIHKSQHPLSKNYKVWKVERKHGIIGRNILFWEAFLLNKRELDIEYFRTLGLPQWFHI